MSARRASDRVINLGIVSRDQLRGAKGFRRLLAACTSVVSATCLLIAAQAISPLISRASADVPGAYIYWANETGNTIGRANLDGSGVDASFIQDGAYSYPLGVAVDDNYIYWTNYSNGTAQGVGGTTIGRANLDGSGINEDLITGVASPMAITTTATSLFWGNYGWAQGTSTAIGESALDGSSPNQDFLGVFAAGLANDGTYLYWAAQSANTIGRVSLNGSGADSNFITGASDPNGVAVFGSYIYWTNSSAGTIGRANLDGTGVDQSFITGASSPAGIAVDSSNIYWTNSSAGTIGRANLDGTDINQSLITGLSNPQGIAVNPDAADGAPLPSFTVSSPGEINPGSTVSFDAGGSTDAGSAITSYAWNFGDGATSTGVMTSHTYAAAGAHTVTLTETNSNGQSSSTTQTVNVFSPPVCSLAVSGNTDAVTGVPYTFDGSGSTDPGQTLSSYGWSFGDGSTGSGVSVTHPYGSPGLYVVSLTVTDAHRIASSCSTTVKVISPPAPVVVPNIGAAETVAGQAVSFTATGSTVAAGSIVSYEWSFGDGITETGETTTHTYAQAGDYTAKLTVTSSYGVSAFKTITVKVVPPFTFSEMSPASAMVSTTTPMLSWRVSGGDGTTPTATIHLVRIGADGKTTSPTEKASVKLASANSSYKFKRPLPTGTYQWWISSTDPRVTSSAKQTLTTGPPIGATTTAGTGDTVLTVVSMSSPRVTLIDKWHGHQTRSHTILTDGFVGLSHNGTGSYDIPWTCSTPGRHSVTLSSGKAAPITITYASESCDTRWSTHWTTPVATVNRSQLASTVDLHLTVLDGWHHRDTYRLCVVEPNNRSSCVTQTSGSDGTAHVSVPVTALQGTYRFRVDILSSGDWHESGSLGSINVVSPTKPAPTITAPPLPPAPAGPPTLLPSLPVPVASADISAYETRQAARTCILGCTFQGVQIEGCTRDQRSSVTCAIWQYLDLDEAPVGSAAEPFQCEFWVDAYLSSSQSADTRYDGFAVQFRQARKGVCGEG